jgi:hypothetical protein
VKRWSGTRLRMPTALRDSHSIVLGLMPLLHGSRVKTSILLSISRFPRALPSRFRACTSPEELQRQLDPGRGRKFEKTSISRSAHDPLNDCWPFTRRESVVASHSAADPRLDNVDEPLRPATSRGLVEYAFDVGVPVGWLVRSCSKVLGAFPPHFLPVEHPARVQRALSGFVGSPFVCA